MIDDRDKNHTNILKLVINVNIQPNPIIIDLKGLSKFLYYTTFLHPILFEIYQLSCVLLIIFYVDMCTPVTLRLIVKYTSRTVFGGP